MASQKTKFAVGVFVAGGIALAMLAVIWLGMSRFLEKGLFYVSYFNESVQGLTVDSPVKYRGVSVGRVDSIGVAPDAKLIQVVLKIETGQTLDSSIVAQLKSVGITGSMFVELDRKKSGEPDRSPPLSFPSEFPVVASKPSEISELLRSLDDVLNHIKSMDLKGISDKIKLTLGDISQVVSGANVDGLSRKVGITLDTMNRALADADVKAISKRLQSSLKKVDSILDEKQWERIMASIEEASHSLNLLMGDADRSMDLVETTLEHVEGIVVEEENAIKASVEDFRRAMNNANILLQKGSSLIAGADDSLSHLKRYLITTSQNLERASENLNRLIELISDHPSQLFFGEPPVPRKLEPES
ncbi:MlaD family protein [Thermodesulfobacteriota bacterium]